ncbi:ABC transporter ATP-binding protein [Nocardioides jishulii]|uniref:ABC transporter ATP-binding protein n=1 Tax=Nocardioides jishulii TaxID=2575440 RepID=A0A4U2YR52_9ACTN|nr:ABC transporter ATP-binding protein [Nocardioides jishulii]QCX26280.1 ABC transporter ATP-binding protein [Nocardioides jishulii]TKI63916.1 ABC transporter ATP-binding protein [Nocardioides jishulii]
MTAALTPTPTAARLAARGVTLAYGERVISTDLTVEVPDGAFTAVVGANACGKSTLLRSMVRLLEPRTGAVELDGVDVRRLRPREVARQIGFLPQRLTPPEGIAVEPLVRRGRHPHRTLLSTWTPADQAAVDLAMAAAGVTDLADRRVEELSGGQAQRAWIAMVLAQETPYLLLDEPTTFLDIAHQYELLRLLAHLRDEGRTVVAVLHDVNQACRFADHLVAMKAGAVVAAGPPAEVMTPGLVREVFGMECDVVADPVAGTPMVVPH